MQAEQYRHPRRNLSSVENSFPKDTTRERMSEKKTKKEKTSRIGEDMFMKRLTTLTERNKDRYYYLEAFKETQTNRRQKSGNRWDIKNGWTKRDSKLD